MKKRLGLIGLLLISSVSIATDYKAMYLEELGKTQAIKEKIDSVKERKSLYNDYFYLYKNNAKHYSFNNTITKQYLDYHYTLSDNKITAYNHRNLIAFHQDQIDEMVLSIKSNKPSVTVAIDKDYNVYINGELLGSSGAE